MGGVVDRSLKAMTCFAMMLLLFVTVVLHAQEASAGGGSKEEDEDLEELFLLAAGGGGGVSKQQEHHHQQAGRISSWRRRASDEELVPAQGVEYRTLEHAPTPPFRTCAACRCCSPSDASRCVQTSCCFGINCNLPDKPFGVCAFTPLTCGCGNDNNNCAA